MSSTSEHPRRRYLNGASPAAPSSPLTLETSLHGCQSLRKSSTFSIPSSPSSDEDPTLSIPALPRRSPTSPNDLENLVAAVERSLSGLEIFGAKVNATAASRALPLPRFVVEADAEDSRQPGHRLSETTQELPTRRHSRRHHSSDSGIGSSISDSESSKSACALLRHEAAASSAAPESSTDGHASSGVNGVSSSFLTSSQHALSEYACRQIQKFIIVPILREDCLKDYHTLVRGIPHRVASREITCLRDLEKVLLWLAPQRSTSKASFFNFCETSIQCIHTTVSHLNDVDQRRPTDRPYTNGYFLDLVEQIRQYAAMISEARAGRAAVSGDAESSSGEKVRLVGGLGRTGRPAELVRIRNGRSVSLRTGQEVSLEAMSTPQGTKRSASEASDGDDVLRSMARRRKNALPVVKEVQRCHECDKVFKRPCDLTKHEKTHSRPWKCSEVTCKYHEYGWPTEKERDRHANDKHSVSPPLYKCHYHPCPYESKRESNCKQHMEKAHGWVYHRSKNNGKAGRGATSTHTPSNSTPHTPTMSTPGSYVLDAPTPELGDSPQTDSTLLRIESHEASLPGSDFSGPLTGESIMNFNDTFGPLDPNFAWDGHAIEGPNHPTWLNSDMTGVQPDGSSFENSFLPQVDEESSLFGDSFDWSHVNQNMTTMNLQLLTPAGSVKTRSLDAFSHHPSISEDPLSHLPPSLSPGAQANIMLYSPHSLYSTTASVDDGYADFSNELRKPADDFRLFDDSCGASPSMADSMFQDLSQFPVNSTWTGDEELASSLGLGDEVMQMD